VDVTAIGQYESKTPAHTHAFRITLKGLTGGHSGIDIHKGRGNANKLMNRLLYTLARETDIEICSVEGGSLRNAIPRESVSVVVLAEGQVDAFQKCIAQYQSAYQLEHQSTDPNLQLIAEPVEKPASVLNADFQFKLIRTLYACHHGIYRMSPDIASLVQTSNNLSRVHVKDGQYSIQCLTRSSVDTEKMDLANALTASFEMLGAAVSYGGNYPGWMPNPHAPIVQLMSQLYTEMFGQEAHVSACHAGLECGILGTNYPHIQMISFGPNIYGAHSPDEKVQISSVQKYWGFLLETLKRIPVKS
jgi:dipeptidase D